MRFLVDNALSRQVAEGLRKAGHDAVHVWDRGLQAATDTEVLDCAAREDRVLVSSDADFGSVLALRQDTKPSVILFRLNFPRRPEAQTTLLLANLPNLTGILEQGAMIVLEETRIRYRPLPVISRPDGQ
jgi:predicted nuclease of predicted toxin-antitoxin system